MTDPEIDAAVTLAKAQRDHDLAIEPEQWRQIRDALLHLAGARTWRPIAEHDGTKTPVMLALDFNDRWSIGEAYFDPETGLNGEWWWANMSAETYPGEHIVYVHGSMFQPLPPPPGEDEK